jgi:hypothetical protein
VSAESEMIRMHGGQREVREIAFALYLNFKDVHTERAML